MNQRPLNIVLIPGFMLDETLWDELIKELPNNCNIIKASLTEGKTIAKMAQHIVQTAPAQFILIGFSLGGYIARSIATHYPEKVSALILIASSLRPDTPEQKAIKLASTKLTSQVKFHGLSLSAIAKTLHASNANNKPLLERIQKMGANLGFDVFVNQSLLDRNELETRPIQCPTLIIYGDQDQMRSPEEALQLHNHITNSSLEQIQDTGHMIPLEQPKQLATTLLQWLTQNQLISLPVQL